MLRAPQNRIYTLFWDCLHHYYSQINRQYRLQQMQWKTSYPLEARTWDLATARQRWIHCTTTRPSKKRWNHRVLLLHLWGCRETSVLHARFPHLPLGTRGYSGIFLILTYQGTEANTYTKKQALSPATNATKNLLPPGRLEPETLQLPGRGVRGFSLHLLQAIVQVYL